MLCKNPFIKLSEKKSYGCGQCFHCRLNRRREWEGRLLIEHLAWENSCFVTLTYDNKHLPLHPSGRPMWDKEAHTGFLKRLREKLSHADRKLRYFGCVEFGRNGDNPHFHFIIFGVSEFEKSLIDSCWNGGFTMVGDVNKNSIRYTAKYVLKSLNELDQDVFNERSFKSQGLGKTALPQLLNIATTMNDDRPLTSIRHEGKLYPVGRYLTKLQKNYLGVNVNEKGEEEKTLYQLQKEVEFEEKLLKIFTKNALVKKTKIKKMLLDENQQARLNRETRTKIFTQKESL